MDKIYHGCGKGHVDGSHSLMKKGKTCLALTANCFWKDPHDVINSVKTHSQTEKQSIIDWRSMMDYFNMKRKMLNSV